MHVLPELPYSYSALEPFIDTETMHVHHDKHHATYVKNLNDALSGHSKLQELEINELLKDLSVVPEDIRTKVKNNAGGHANHTLFWEMMGPTGGKPEGEFLEAINSTFGSFESFKEKFSSVAVSRFGSGWAWLTYDGKTLSIIDTANQDSPVSEGKSPVLLLDVWEHAYYLKYKNVRADYVSAWWNVVNWKKVGELFKKAGEKK